MFIRSLLAAATIGAALLAPTAASAIVYTIDATVSGGSATGTIETDGTLGALSSGNIVDWSITLDDGTGTFLLDGFANSQVLVSGSSFTASATGLFFDFANTNFDIVLFQNPSIGSGINFLCFDGASGTCISNLSSITVRLTDPASEVVSPQLGNVQFASAGDAVVPEPASWALMIAGFGLTGFAMRRRAAAIAA